MIFKVPVYPLCRSPSAGLGTSASALFTPFFLAIVRRRHRTLTLASHVLLKAANVSADSHHPSCGLRCGGGGTSLCLYCIEKDFGERLSHFGDGTGLRGLLGGVGGNSIASLSAISVESELLSVELSSGFSRQHEFGRCDMAAEADVHV